MEVSFLIWGNFGEISEIDFHLLLEEYKNLFKPFPLAIFSVNIFFFQSTDLRDEVKAFIKNEHLG